MQTKWTQSKMTLQLFPWSGNYAMRNPRSRNGMTWCCFFGQVPTAIRVIGSLCLPYDPEIIINMHIFGNDCCATSLDARTLCVVQNRRCRFFPVWRCESVCAAWIQICLYHAGLELSSIAKKKKEYYFTYRPKILLENRLIFFFFFWLRSASRLL